MLLFWVYVFLVMELRRGGWQHTRINVYLEWRTLVPRCSTAVQNLPELSRLSWPRLLLSLVLYSVTAPRCTIRKMSHPIVFMREDLAYNSSSHPFHTTITISAFTPTTPLPRSLWGITSPCKFSQESCLLSSSQLGWKPTWVALIGQFVSPRSYLTLNTCLLNKLVRAEKPTT